MTEDYYKTLGVSRDASQADIQRAYRNLARKYHPDLNPDDKSAKDKFQKVQKAFDVLNDSEKREMYDRYGSAFESMGAGAGRGDPKWGAGSPGQFNFEDIDLGQIFGQGFGGNVGEGAFGDIFRQFRQAKPRGGSRPGTAPPRKGVDIHHEIEIPLSVAVTGGEVQVTVHRRTGKTETLAVKIPPGIEDGKKIRVRGQGDAGRDGTRGDILLAVHVAPHPSFQRRGNNLLVKAPVTLAEAAGGAKVDVPTPRGTVAVRVPPETSSGAKLRVKGHGVAPRGGSPGDLLVEIQIVLPQGLSEQDRETLCQISQKYPQNPRAQLAW